MIRYGPPGVRAALSWLRPGYIKIHKGDGKKPSPFCYAKEDRKEVMPGKRKVSRAGGGSTATTTQKGIEKEVTKNDRNANS